MSIKAIEVFKSHQGEGKYTGTLMTFIRFKNCRKPNCMPLCRFCDTMTKMTTSLEMSFEVKDIDSLVRSTNYNICFTGGEPTLYLDDIKEIILYFKDNIIKHVTSCVHFETNGYDLKGLYNLLNNTIQLDKSKYFIAFSPKFQNEDECQTMIQYTTDLKDIVNNDRTIIKVVLGKDNEDLVTDYLNGIPKELLPLVTLMPMGVTEVELKESMPIVSKISMKYKVNISDRLHIIHSFM
jgi:organic radical activating enzyme